MPPETFAPDPEEIAIWRSKITLANQHNVLCTCRTCGREWMSSGKVSLCTCGSQDVALLLCWQFPDD